MLCDAWGPEKLFLEILVEGARATVSPSCIGPGMRFDARCSRRRGAAMVFAALSLSLDHRTCRSQAFRCSISTGSLENERHSGIRPGIGKHTRDTRQARQPLVVSCRQRLGMPTRGLEMPEATKGLPPVWMTSLIAACLAAREVYSCPSAANSSRSTVASISLIIRHCLRSRNGSRPSAIADQPPTVRQLVLLRRAATRHAL